MSKTISDLFEQYIGTKEYNGIVSTIQTWFYGSLVKMSWCATSASYFANEVGILDQLGGKNENVYLMMEATRKASKELGKGAFYYAKEIPKGLEIPRGSVLFILHSGTTMTTTSSKHVTTANETFRYTGKGYFGGLGGNQSDMIRVSQYAQSRIYAVFIPDYGAEKHETLRKGDKGGDVKDLQRILNDYGYRDNYGSTLAVDGSYGARTESAVKGFQDDQGLVIDGVCGKKTWAAIDAMVANGNYKVEIVTDLYCRVGPGHWYAEKGVLRTGNTYTLMRTDGDWAYLKEPDGWSRMKNGDTPYIIRSN